MKANLATFVDDLARSLQLDGWDLEPNPDAPGGRVLIVEGDLAHNAQMIQRLSQDAAALGNYPIDLLACVPPALVTHDMGDTPSIPGQVLKAAGQSVWDAASQDVRERYPTDRDALRIVQYDSCRGLEGWTVINYALDEFWKYKFQECISKDTQPDELETVEDRARRDASLWTMIPLTRAMDTLVINITTTSGLIREALEYVSRRRGDFVEWVTL
jgi:hypothetical protein